MSELAVLGNTPVNYSILESLYPGYKSPYSKIAALEKAGRIIRLKKGMYVVAPRESGKLLSMELIANHHLQALPVCRTRVVVEVAINDFP